MQENNNQRQLAHAVIAEVTAYVNTLLSRSLSAGVDNQKRSTLVIQANFVPAGNNHSIHTNVESESAIATIGIWLGSKTMDISIWSTDTYDSLYEFHGDYATVAKVKQCLEEVVDVLT